MVSADLNVATADDGTEAVKFLGERLINAILEEEPIKAIKDLIDSGAPVWFQNDEEGMSPLHAAAYTQNVELIKMLIEEGAVWNALDNLKYNAGDIALSFNDVQSYTLIRDAGIRSELLLTLLSSRVSLEAPSTLVFRATDLTAAASTEAFLSSKLRFTRDKYGQDICLLKVGDDEEIGVMMGWELDIMKESVKRLCSNHDRANELKVLNVGFGLGIIDTIFQSLPTRPSQHVIIEPHPDVLQHMKELGWYEKPGVKILEGKWQAFIDSDELLGTGGFDVVYTDTFSEDYGPESRFSFFNGLGATHALFYDVYTHIAELHLAEAGIDVRWSDVDVTCGAKDRWGKSREYFTTPLYRLPIGQMTARA